MAIRKLTNAAYLATNWQDEVESKNDLKKGLCIVDLDTTNKQIKAGSVIEANGVVYKSDTATSMTNSPTNDAEYYIYFRDIESVLDFYYSTEIPAFNILKNGWYGSTNTTWRAIAKVYLNTTWTGKIYENYFSKHLYDEIYFNNLVRNLNVEYSGTFKNPVTNIVPTAVYTIPTITSLYLNDEIHNLFKYNLWILFNNIVRELNVTYTDVSLNPIDGVKPTGSITYVETSMKMFYYPYNKYFNNLVYDINTIYSATFKNPVTNSVPTVRL